MRTWPRPYSGVHPRNSGCSSRTTSPSANGCCPTALPTGPEKLPVCTQETRSGSPCVSGHHSGCSGGMVRCSSPAWTDHVAADSARVLQCGR